MAHLSKKIEMLSFSQAEMYAKRKSLPNIFIMLGHCTIVHVAHIEYGKHHETDLIWISVYSFCRAFYGGFFNEIILEGRDIREIKMSKKLLVHSVTIHFTTPQYFSCISLTFIYK